jgi:hypothetical protein
MELVQKTRLSGAEFDLQLDHCAKLKKIFFIFGGYFTDIV